MRIVFENKRIALVVRFCEEPCWTKPFHVLSNFKVIKFESAAVTTIRMEEASTSQINGTATNHDSTDLLTFDVELGTKLSRIKSSVVENEVRSELRAKTLGLKFEQLQQEYDENLKKLEQLDENLHILKEHQTYSEMDNASIKTSIETTKKLMDILQTNLFNVEDACNSNVVASKTFIDAVDKSEAELKFLKDFYNDNFLWKESAILDLEMQELKMEKAYAPELHKLLFELEQLEKIIEHLQSEVSQKNTSVLDEENSKLQKEIEFLTAEINKLSADESVGIEENDKKNILLEIDAAQQSLEAIQSEIESIRENKDGTIEKLDQEFLQKVDVQEELSRKADNLRSQSTQILETWQKKFIDQRKLFDELNNLKIILQTNQRSLAKLEVKINEHAEKLEQFSQLLMTFESEQKEEFFHISDSLSDLTDFYEEVNIIIQRYNTKNEELKNVQAQQKTISSSSAKLPEMKNELVAQSVKLQLLQEEMQTKERLFEKLQKDKSDLVTQLEPYKARNERNVFQRSRAEINSAPRVGTSVGPQNAFDALLELLEKNTDQPYEKKARLE